MDDYFNLAIMMLLLSNSDENFSITKDSITPEHRKRVKEIILDSFELVEDFYLENEFNEKIQKMNKLINLFEVDITYNEYLIDFQKKYNIMNNYYSKMLDNLCELNKYVYEQDNEDLKELLKKYNLNLYSQGFGGVEKV